MLNNSHIDNNDNNYNNKINNNNNNHNNNSNNNNNIKIENREKEKTEPNNKTDDSLLFLEIKNKNDIDILEKNSTNIFHEISSLNEFENNFVEKNEKKENKKVKISSQIIIKSKNLNNFDIDYDFRQNKKEVNLIPHLNNNFQFQDGPSPFLLLHILVSIFFITVKANFVSVCNFFFFFVFFFYFLFFLCENNPDHFVI